MKGSLRVIGGNARGMRLKTVPGDTTRPITDIVKEALFNILGSEILENNILDLFGGTGAVGIEALSRGAKFVTFLEKSQQAIQTIHSNLATTRFTGQAKVICRRLHVSHHKHRRYDLIYIALPNIRKWQRSYDPDRWQAEATYRRWSDHRSDQPHRMGRKDLSQPERV